MSQLPRIDDFLEFLNAGVTSSHATVEIVKRLDAAGFNPWEEANKWDPKPGDAAYAIRGDSAVIAFRVGLKPSSESGFRIVGAHTDVPGLRVKPSGPYTSDGYRCLGVEVYGGPTLATWTDRDLTLAGRVWLRNSDNPFPLLRLVNFEKPVCRIPNVAIHLNRGVNKDGLTLNEQKNLPPICGLDGETPFDSDYLVGKLAEYLKCKPEEIVDYNLEVVDTQKAARGGFDDELYFSGRIDNLGGTYTSLMAIIEANENSDPTRVAALFDHEEVGSSTFNGGASNFLDCVLERLCPDRGAFLQALSQSMLISNDGAHAVHPNYADLHEPRHKPKLNGGPVLKINAKERYVTHGPGCAYFQQICEKAGVPMQKFVVRTDMPCGSTIGPFVATRLGIPGADVGLPMLSMHSIREAGGVEDAELMIQALKKHFA